MRRCSVHGAKLWPKPQVRPIRFHDLRHTTASLLLQAGAPLHAVQRILRHRDPRMTANVYGHLSPDYLRAEIDRLRFKTDSAAPATDRRVPLMSPSPKKGPHAREVLPRNVPAAFMVSGTTPAGLEPATPGFEGRCSIQMSYGASSRSSSTPRHLGRRSFLMRVAMTRRALVLPPARPRPQGGPDQRFG
jgi:hypothetical protein